MQTPIDPRSLIGRKTFDSSGIKIGRVGEVYLDDATGEPEWVAVRTGLLRRETFIPLAAGELVDDELRICFDRAVVRGAPDLGVGRHLSPQQELALYRYYGLDVPADAEDPSPAPLLDRDFGRIAGGPEG